MWPIPEKITTLPDVVFLSIYDEDLLGVRRLLDSVSSLPPTMIAVVSYENPTTLQIVLEYKFFGIIERPIRTFGLLANLAVARNLWLQHQVTVKELRNYRRRALGDQKVLRAKAVLMAAKHLTEDEAYREMRSRAQSARLPIESIAVAILEEAGRRSVAECSGA
jgi:AmiR/NasT family two-component response regulator